WAGHPALVELRLEILEAIAEETELAPLCELIGGRAERIAPGTAFAFLRVDDDGRLRALAGPGLPPGYLGELDGVVSPFAPGAASEADGGATIVDVAADPNWTGLQPIFLPAGYRACWLAPIRAESATIGVLAAYRRQYRALDWAGRALLACCVDLSSVAIRKDALRQRLRLTNERFAVALRNMSQGVCFFDGTGRLLLANERFAEIYGLRSEDIGPGITLKEILEMRVAAGSGPVMMAENYLAWNDAIRVMDTVTTRVIELVNGKTIATQVNPMPDHGWVATHEDITDRCRAEARVAHMARHDGLTGLANRVLFQERLEQALSLVSRGRLHAVLCVDLDRFKPVNDSFGHPTGDKLLQAVASRLLGCVRDVDTVARIGGDEFAILALHVDRTERVGELAQRVVRVLSEPFQIDGNTIAIGASVGIALCPSDADTPDELINHADMALYRAKMDGRGRYCFFEAEMGARLRERFSLERDLRQALVRNEFELMYQPLFDLERGLVSGFEALLRWRHPDRGLVMPDNFIPIAEETGLIVPIGAWVLRRACQEALGWPADVTVSVNLSAVQFKSSDLVRVVRDVLASTGLPAGRLELEITESTLLEDNAATLQTLRELGRLGVRFSMDDFGTGYSSLSYLRSFPFDKIKIDQSFIRDLTARTNSLAIVRAIVGLGRSLNMLTTAEGVETREQFESLRAEGCNEVQGYYLSQPRPAADIPEMLSSRSCESPQKPA
ncbi:MAG TPA: EAL domain-containing protein, partial [Bradyrhizobium sp.]